ncbi:hypothetical protein T4D_3142 [Trichinella pseudospiralis]|uniref:Uncharacterized protein n=1 Tax=Trichinella pseudospiralis TaxID=6337 RepID=A0A0V1G5E7_TRIPS|nr:hypothetical protein T4D_3142 [Trichinella pseudospiralis]
MVSWMDLSNNQNYPQECIRERPMTFNAYLQCISGGVSHHSLVISHVWKRSSTSHLLMNTGIY